MVLIAVFFASSFASSTDSSRALFNTGSSRSAMTNTFEYEYGQDLSVTYQHYTEIIEKGESTRQAMHAR